MLKIDPARASEPSKTTIRRSAAPTGCAVRDGVVGGRPNVAFPDPDGIRFISFLLCLSEQSIAKPNSFVNLAFCRWGTVDF
jgi:hypothetical protein